MHIRINPDTEYVKDVRRQLKANNGYCPCKLEHKPENKCICRDFNDMCERGETGMCHCGLYIAERE